MIRRLLCCASVLAMVSAQVPAHAQVAKTKPAAAADEDCAERIRKLDASDAEGAERLTAKWEVVEFCAKEFKRDKTVQQLVKACAKHLQQPVITQLLVAECQLAAYRYGGAMRMLKDDARQ